MSYPSILVHLDTGAHAQSRLELALHFAHRFHAKLTGVLSTYTPDAHALFIMGGTASYYIEHEQQRQDRCTTLQHHFHAALTRHRVEGQWIEATGYANDVIPSYARLADLIVVGQTDLNDPESFVAEQFIENLLMTAGRPVLVVPSSASITALGPRLCGDERVLW